MSAIAPLRLPVLSASVVQAQAILARRGLSLPLHAWPFPGPHPVLSLSLANEASGPDVQQPLLGHEPLLRLDFEWAGARFHLDTTSSAVDHWAQVSLGGQTLQSLDEAWRDAALEAATRWLTTTLTGMGRGHARYIGHQQTQVQRPGNTVHALWLSLYAHDASDAQDAAAFPPAFHGLLYTDNLGMILLASLLPEHAGPRNSSPWSDVSSFEVPLRLTVGATDLTSADVTSLSRGDVVFMTHRYAQGAQHLLLQSDPHHNQSWQVGVQLDDLQLTLLEAPRLMTEAPDSPASSSPGESLSLDALPIRITFDVGDKVLTVAQLRDLTMGDTLRLDRPTTEYVTIRAQGVVIGRGHLVEIDNRLGVALDHLNAPQPSTPRVDPA